MSLVTAPAVASAVASVAAVACATGRAIVRPGQCRSPFAPIAGPAAVPMPAGFSRLTHGDCTDEHGADHRGKCEPEHPCPPFMALPPCRS